MSIRLKNAVTFASVCAGPLKPKADEGVGRGPGVRPTVAALRCLEKIEDFLHYAGGAFCLKKELGVRGAVQYD